MKFISHPNIISIHTVYETKSTIYMIMNLFLGGNLHEVLKKKKRLEENDAKIILLKLLSALSYLHANNIMHRDIKTENILFFKENCDYEDVCLVDFGLAQFANEKFLHYRCGTPGNVAPEILKSKKNERYSCVCDIFSLGTVFYKMYILLIFYFYNLVFLILLDFI